RVAPAALRSAPTRRSSDLLDNQVPTEVQVKLQHDYVCLLDRSSRWLVQQAPDSLDVDSGIEMYGKVVESLRSRVPDLVDGYDAEDRESTRLNSSHVSRSYA